MEITIAINLTDVFGSHQSNIGTILIELEDIYNIILNKINVLLNKHYLNPVHYISENGNITKLGSDMNNLFEVIKHNPTFYVYYNH
jgi:hypothetical protein